MQRSNANLTWFDWQLYAKDDWRSSHPSCRVDWNGNGVIDTGEDVEGDTVLQTGTWYHIACTYDGTAMKLYINGTLRDITPKSEGTIPNSGRGIRIGANETWGAYFDGILDETRIYNQALSEAEIQALMSPPTTCYTLTLGHTGQGSNPAASPANSTGCATGQYVAGEVINLSGAIPASGWQISGWTGTSNDASTASTNAVTMPASVHSASVIYMDIAPTVLSVTRRDANPTSAAIVGFTVTFSEAVTGVDVSDFSLTTSGVSGAAVSGISGSGSTYTITVNTGSGNGTIRLDVVNDDTIVDVALNPLGAGFTSGEIYTVSKAATFGDVPLLYWANSYIERLYNAGITGGCASNPLQYCPESSVIRGQMAVFLERGIHGSSYTIPLRLVPVLASTMFLPTTGLRPGSNNWRRMGSPGGCGSGNYCPDDPVTRAQMAVFLLKS